MTIQSFSGTHPYRVECLEQRIRADADDDYLSVEEQVYELDLRISEGLCPRCGGEMPESQPAPWGGATAGAGSRVTSCRCIPVCGMCGSDEATYPVSPAWWEPGIIDWREEIAERQRHWMEAAEEVTLDVSSGTPKILSDDGVADAQLRDHPGGWAEFGHDDEP